MPFRTPGRLAAAVITVAVTLGAGGSAGAATTPRTPAAALKALTAQTKLVPKTVLGASQRRRLLALAAHARRRASANPCVAVTDLNGFRRILRSVKVNTVASRRKANAKLARLGPASVLASGRLLASKKTKACGGGIAPPTRTAPKTTVASSDVNGVNLTVAMPALGFRPQTGGGKSWTQLVLPDSGSPSGTGAPGIPVVSTDFAVPDGAKVTVTPGSTQSYTVDGVDVFPQQGDPADATAPGGEPDFTKGPFATKPFAIDKVAYATPGLVPASPADGGIIGQARDVTIGGLQLPAVQFDPVKHVLKVFTSIGVKVSFDGGPKTFSDDLGSPWERAQRNLLATLVNGDIAVSKIPFGIRRCGEEMLVITNPATQAAADQLATAKRAQGMRTNVFQVGAAAGQIGTTAAQIQAFIRSQLTAVLCIHPSYITIMGDDDLVPTNAGINGIPSDLPYALKTDSDELPDVAIGRIIGNDQTEVGNAVTKIVGYETTAPTANGMLNKALVAAYFQDDGATGTESRNFVQFAETVRNGLLARGVATDRVYTTSAAENPQSFHDGTPLPAALKRPTFGWNGTGADVSTAWNDGRFLVVHRDHGWSDGWGDPSFTTTDVNALSNGSKLPVVLSINCSSGAYDYDETSFAGQALVKPDGGAVGVFGDTRDSPTFANTEIALGFADALLPSILPGEGPAAKQRTGDALVAGKLRLAGIAPPPNGDTRNELYLWHYYGDPSMQMWGGGSPPIVFNPAVITAIYKPGPISIPDPPPYEVEVGNLPHEMLGQPVSLLRNGQVIGKAFAGDGAATIPAAFGDGSVKPGELEVAFEGDGAQPVKIPVSGVPDQGTPDLVIGSLTANTVTVKNSGAGAAAASKVTLSDSANASITLDVPALDPGASSTLSYDCSKLARVRSAKADSAGTVGESNEDNNTASGTFDCPLPDLIVTGLTASSVTVKNQGTGPAGTSTTRITNSTQENIDLATPALAPGASITITYDCAKIGGRGFFATADFGNVVTEGDEENNQFTPQQLLACGG
jgi:hypothetical protein